MTHGSDDRTARRGRRGPARWWALVLPVVLVGILASCAAVMVLAFRQDEDGEVEIVVLAGQDLSGARKAQIDHWNSQHRNDGWSARLVSLPPSADAQRVETAARLAAGDPVDLVVMDVTQTPEFARAGYLRRMSGVDTSGFLAGPLDTCRYEGRLWALPLNTDAGLLFLNLDRFRKLTERRSPGSSFPETDFENATLTESVSRIGSMLREDDRAGKVARAAFAGQFADYEGYTVNMLELLRAEKAPLDGGGFDLDDPASVNAMQTVSEVLEQDRVLPPEVSGLTEDSATAAFLTGDVVLMRNWPVAYRTLRDESRERKMRIDSWVKVAPLRSGVLGGQNIAVTRSSRHPRAARSLAEFLTGDLSQQALFEKGGFASTRESVYSDPRIGQAYPYADALLTAVKDARPRPAGPHYWRFSVLFRRIVECARTHDGTLPQRAGELLDRAGKGKTTDFRCED